MVSAAGLTTKDRRPARTRVPQITAWACEPACRDRFDDISETGEFTYLLQPTRAENDSASRVGQDRA